MHSYFSQKPPKSLNSADLLRISTPVDLFTEGDKNDLTDTPPNSCLNYRNFCGFIKYRSLMVLSLLLCMLYRLWQKYCESFQLEQIFLTNWKKLDTQAILDTGASLCCKLYQQLTLVLLNQDWSCFWQQCRSRSVGFFKANWSRSALIVIQYLNLYQHSGLSNPIGWQLEIGVAS